MYQNGPTGLGRLSASWGDYRLKSPVIIIGLGQLGQLFGAGLLAEGVGVIPVTRGINMATLAAEVPDPQMVLVATGEDDLAPVLTALPSSWQSRVALLQNELTPRSWQAAGIPQPTVAVVWCEKKAGRAPTPLLSTPVYGPAASLLVSALNRLAIPAHTLDSEQALLFEMALKNVYIWTTNIAGLRVGGTVGELWSRHRALTREIMAEVLRIQEALFATEWDPVEMERGFERAVQGDPNHAATGRTAPRRLERLLALAHDVGVACPAITALADGRAAR